jgi:hypothetical protein
MSASTENQTAEVEEQMPLLRVVSPHATPEEIAVITALFAAMGSGEAAPAKKRPSEWASPARRVRRTLPHGLGGWKASALPR